MVGGGNGRQRLWSKLDKVSAFKRDMTNSPGSPINVFAASTCQTCFLEFHCRQSSLHFSCGFPEFVITFINCWPVRQTKWETNYWRCWVYPCQRLSVSGLATIQARSLKSVVSAFSHKMHLVDWSYEVWCSVALTVQEEKTVQAVKTTWLSLRHRDS